MKFFTKFSIELDISYNHSYTNTDKNTNRCKNCDFDTDCVDSIEVHMGACRNKILNMVNVKKN